LLFLPNRQLAIWHPAAVHRLSAKSSKRRCLVPASGLYEWPKEGHAISPTFTPESSADEAPGSVDLFGTPAPSKKKAAKPIKRVFAITTTEPGPFAFAGIWDAWKRPDGTYLETFAIVTTEPNELVAQIHDRLAISNCMTTFPARCS
jgi:putative SOS response-associated peptidase YedK